MGREPLLVLDVIGRRHWDPLHRYPLFRFSTSGRTCAHSTFPRRACGAALPFCLLLLPVPAGRAAGRASRAGPAGEGSQSQYSHHPITARVACKHELQLPEVACWQRGRIIIHELGMALLDRCSDYQPPLYRSPPFLALFRKPAVVVSRRMLASSWNALPVLAESKGRASARARR